MNSGMASLSTVEKDRRFTVVVARIHIRVKLQQLFFHIGEESLVEP
jgi:hypothetical protein